MLVCLFGFSVPPAVICMLFIRGARSVDSSMHALVNSLLNRKTCTVMNAQTCMYTYRVFCSFFPHMQVK